MRNAIVDSFSASSSFLIRYDTNSIVVKVCLNALHRGDGAGVFPDAVSARATKHLLESQVAMERGHRAALVFAVLHDGITRVTPAQVIDPIYASALRQAIASGLEVYTLLNDITVDGIYPVAAHRWDTH